MGVPSRLGKVGVLGSATSTQNYVDFEMGGGILQTLAFGGGAVSECAPEWLQGHTKTDSSLAQGELSGNVLTNQQSSLFKRYLFNAMPLLPCH